MPAVSIGTCQACFHRQKIRNGVLVLHGYQRPGIGSIVGTCRGTDELPYEESCEVTKQVRANFQRQLDANRDAIARLEDRPETVEYRAQEYVPATWENRRSSYRWLPPITIHRGDPQKGDPYRRSSGYVPSYEDAVRSNIERLEAEDRLVEKEVEFLTDKIDTWQTRPLIPVATTAVPARVYPACPDCGQVFHGDTSYPHRKNLRRAEIELYAHRRNSHEKHETLGEMLATMRAE